MTSNPGVEDKEVIDNVSIILRKHGSELISKSSIIPFYNIWYYLRLLPSYEDIKKVSKNLIGLSNSLHSSTTKAISDTDIAENNYKRNNEIKILLATYYSKIPINQLFIVFVLILIFVFTLLSYKDEILELYCDENTSITKSKYYDFNGSIVIHKK